MIGSVSLAHTVARYFALGFVGSFLPAVVALATNVANTGDVSVPRAALVSLVAGAVAAGGRAIVAAFPIFASDNGVGISK